MSKEIKPGEYLVLFQMSGAPRALNRIANNLTNQKSIRYISMNASEAFKIFDIENPREHNIKGKPNDIDAIAIPIDGDREDWLKKAEEAINTYSASPTKDRSFEAISLLCSYTKDERTENTMEDWERENFERRISELEDLVKILGKQTHSEKINNLTQQNEILQKENQGLKESYGRLKKRNKSLLFADKIIESKRNTLKKLSNLYDNLIELDAFSLENLNKKSLEKHVISKLAPSLVSLLDSYESIDQVQEDYEHAKLDLDNKIKILEQEKETFSKLTSKLCTILPTLEDIFKLDPELKEIKSISSKQKDYSEKIKNLENEIEGISIELKETDTILKEISKLNSTKEYNILNKIDNSLFENLEATMFVIREEKKISIYIPIKDSPLCRDLINHTRTILKKNGDMIISNNAYEEPILELELQTKTNFTKKAYKNLIKNLEDISNSPFGKLNSKIKIYDCDLNGS